MTVGSRTSLVAVHREPPRCVQNEPEGTAREGRAMSSQSSKRKTKQLSAWQRLLAWRAEWQLGSVRRDVVGVVLLIVAALTVLGLSRISSGAALSWWAAALRRMFGWGAFPVTISLAFLGLFPGLYLM